MKLAAIAEKLGGTVIGNGDLEIERVSAIESAGPHDLTFLANPKYSAYLKSTAAGAIIASAPTADVRASFLIHTDPYYAFSRALMLFNAAPGTQLQPGVAKTAVLDESAQIGDDVHIGEYAVIGAGSRIERGSKIAAHVVIGRNCHVGAYCLIYPHVTIYDDTILGARVTIHSGTVVGSDGFGYATHQGVHHKVYQIGRVCVEDDVEIGANCAIDRGALGDTVIGAGTKIDNLVQIAHNVTTGPGCVIVAQVGIAGSTRLGRYVVLGGQAGLVGHIEIGDLVRVAAQSGITKNLPGGKDYGGTPAREIKTFRLIEAHLHHLPERMDELKALRVQLAALQAEYDKLKQRDHQ